MNKREFCKVMNVVIIEWLL